MNIGECDEYINTCLDILEGNNHSNISLSDAYVIVEYFQRNKEITVERQKQILLTPMRMVIYGANTSTLFISYLRNNTISRGNKQEVALFAIHNHMYVRRLWDIIYQECYDNTICECNLAITIEYLLTVDKHEFTIDNFSILEHYDYDICNVLLAILVSKGKSNYYDRNTAASVLLTNRYHTFKYGYCSYLHDLECRYAYIQLTNCQNPVLWST